MVKESVRLSNFLEELCMISTNLRYREVSFEDIMKSNQTRLDVLNNFFDLIRTGDLSTEEWMFFDRHIDFVHEFLNGQFKGEVTIPVTYYNDMEDCSIIPTYSELETLLDVIKKCIELYNKYYKDKYFILRLPDNTFNENMERILTIKEHNLAHLFGLTESSQKEKQDKNLLMEYFLNNIPNREKYGDTPSIQLVNWIISDEGKQEILRLNNLVWTFIYHDRKQYPTAYDKNGNIKPHSYQKFIERLNRACSPIKFPIIKYSRWLVKTTNTMNFFNMENTSQVILDYNSETYINPKTGKEEKKNKSEKDIYFVNASPDRLNELTKGYLKKLHFFENVINLSKQDKKTYDLLKQKLLSIGIKETEVDNFLNLIINLKYYQDNNISIDDEIKSVMDGVYQFLADKYNREIHFIGFGTDYDKNPDQSMKTYELHEGVVNTAHCDTSLSANIIDLIAEYYARGRAFFIDKIEGPNHSYYYVSTPKDELQYNSQMERLGIPLSEEHKCLINTLDRFNENYMNYRYGNSKRKH